MAKAKVEVKEYCADLNGVASGAAEGVDDHVAPEPVGDVLRDPLRRHAVPRLVVKPAEIGMRVRPMS